MKENSSNPKATIGMKILCFFIPLAGLIIFATNYKRTPLYAKACGIASMIGAGVYAFFTIIFTLIIIPIFLFNFKTIAYNEIKIDNNEQRQDIIEEYNETLEKYEGSRLSSFQVKAVLNLVMVHNSTYSASSILDENYIEVEYNNKRIENNYSSIIVNPKKTYSIRMRYNADGYINKIIIKEGSKI